MIAFSIVDSMLCQGNEDQNVNPQESKSVVRTRNAPCITENIGISETRKRGNEDE